MEICHSDDMNPPPGRTRIGQEGYIGVKSVTVGGIVKIWWKYDYMRYEFVPYDIKNLLRDNSYYSRTRSPLLVKKVEILGLLLTSTSLHH